MKLTDLVTEYCLHDSIFNSVYYDPTSESVEMKIDFAFWMQEQYTSNAPETGEMTLIFHGVRDFICPSEVVWNQVSIIQVTVEEDMIKFSVINDILDWCFDISISCTDVTCVF